MKPTVLPCSVVGRVASWPPAAVVSLVGSRTIMRLLPSGCFQLCSQSTQAPMAAVTALVLLPNQGGMTAPNPPAGPPGGHDQKMIGRLQRRVYGFTTVAHHRALSDIGPFAPAHSRTLIQELGDIALGPAGGSRNCLGITMA